MGKEWSEPKALGLLSWGCEWWVFWLLGSLGATWEFGFRRSQLIQQAAAGYSELLPTSRWAVIWVCSSPCHICSPGRLNFSLGLLEHPDRVGISCIQLVLCGAMVACLSPTRHPVSTVSAVAPGPFHPRGPRCTTLSSANRKTSPHHERSFWFPVDLLLHMFCLKPASAPAPKHTA